MAPQQKRTFLPYTRGINPEDLRLGSLYLNPLDPDDGLESKRFEFQEDLDQDEYEEHIKKHIRKEQKDGHCTLDFELSKDSSLALKFSDWITASGSTNSTIAATLEGVSGRRLKIRKPEKFLKDEVMSQKGASEWIRKQASISFKGRFGTHRFKAPEIWMVTGVQLVTGGEVYAGSSKGGSVGFGAAADVGAAFGAPPGMAAIGVEGRVERNNEANNGYDFEDERVWAAQFMEVKIEYGGAEDKNLQSRDHHVIPEEILAFQLEDIADLKAQGVRGNQEQRARAAGQEIVEPTKPVARMVFDENDNDASSDDEVVLSEQPYSKVLEHTDWDMYNECSQYLVEANARPRSATPEAIRSG